MSAFTTCTRCTSQTLTTLLRASVEMSLPGPRISTSRPAPKMRLFSNYARSSMQNGKSNNRDVQTITPTATTNDELYLPFESGVPQDWKPNPNPTELLHDNDTVHRQDVDRQEAEALAADNEPAIQMIKASRDRKEAGVTKDRWRRRASLPDQDADPATPTTTSIVLPARGIRKTIVITRQNAVGNMNGNDHKQENWQIQKAALNQKFGEQGWQPRKKLSPDAIDGIKALHQQHPTQFTTAVLAQRFEVSPEAIRRILKSKWMPTVQEEESRRQRWDRRGERIWTSLVDRGVNPPKKWREMGVGNRSPRKTMQIREPVTAHVHAARSVTDRIS